MVCYGSCGCVEWSKEVPDFFEVHAVTNAHRAYQSSVNKIAISVNQYEIVVLENCIWSTNVGLKAHIFLLCEIRR